MNEEEIREAFALERRVRKRGLLKKGSFEKGSFEKGGLSKWSIFGDPRDFKEFRDSRDPQSVENKRVSDHFLEILEDSEILEIPPFVITPSSVPENGQK